MADFREEQRFEWFWTAMFCVPAILVGYGVYRQVGMHQPFVPDGLLWPAFAVSVFVAGWFLRLKLLTEIRPDGIYVWFVWLWPERTIPWNEIRSLDVRTYRPIRDFGGWGVRWAARGIVYHARGNRGVRLVLASGERVLIGSQHADELARAIASHSGLTVGSS